VTGSKIEKKVSSFVSANHVNSSPPGLSNQHFNSTAPNSLGNQINPSLISHSINPFSGFQASAVTKLLGRFSPYPNGHSST